MTEILYDRGELRLEMEGHALAGPKGEDLVCAALSILMMSVERRMQEQADEMLPCVRREPGRFVIQCRPESENEARCRESFDTVFAGLSLLAENRPEHVRVSLRDEEQTGEERWS